MKNQLIRILQIGMSTNYGGTEAFLMYTYKNLDRKLFQFDFINVYDNPLACNSEIELLGGHIYYLNLKRRGRYREYKKGINDFYKTHHFDVVQLNSQSMENIDMLKYAKKNGVKKRIVYGHNAGFGLKTKVLTSIMHKLNRIIIARYATNFIAVGETASKWLYPSWIRKKVKIIPNQIDVELFKFNEESRNEIRGKYNLMNKKVYGNVGRLDCQKNHMFLLDIFSEIHKNEPDSVLLIVGQGPLENELKNKTYKLKLMNNVIFAGYQENMEKYYSAFDIFLYPSLFEGFGIVLVEAQCSGLPIVVSDKIPSNALVSDNVYVISLKSTSQKWCSEVLKVHNRTNRQLDYLNIKSLYSGMNLLDKISKIYK